MCTTHKVFTKEPRYIFQGQTIKTSYRIRIGAKIKFNPLRNEMRNTKKKIYNTFNRQNETTKTIDIELYSVLKCCLIVVMVLISRTTIFVINYNYYYYLRLSSRFSRVSWRRLCAMRVFPFLFVPFSSDLIVRPEVAIICIVH